MADLTLCASCKSCVEGKCSDYFEPGVKCACINFLEKDNEDRQHDNNG